MNCTRAQELLSPYLDGAVSGKQMQAVREHLGNCANCNREYVLLTHSQRLLGGLGRKQAPPDLALRLRVAISQEAAAVRRPYFAGVWIRLQNALDAVIVPAAVGAVAAVLVFGLLLGFFALPSQLQASTEDVPLMFYTPPRLQSSGPAGMGVGLINADSVVVEAYVDATGRVEDYRILSGPKDSDKILPELNRTLILTTFRPATQFGRPTPGRAVLTFSKINVRG
ncbi:MAG TPA: zf-HC2 domain-containing protein [Terriglobales bacterium]|nr:zf-HC2 domain-containing protein [Terriglobales bacterium]